jgi:hypothetical protein
MVHLRRTQYPSVLHLQAPQGAVFLELRTMFLGDFHPRIVHHIGRFPSHRRPKSLSPAHLRLMVVYGRIPEPGYVLATASCHDEPHHTAVCAIYDHLYDCHNIDTLPGHRTNVGESLQYPKRHLHEVTRPSNNRPRPVEPLRHSISNGTELRMRLGRSRRLSSRCYTSTTHRSTCGTRICYLNYPLHREGEESK